MNSPFDLEVHLTAKDLAHVVQTTDSAFYQINHYPVAKHV